MAERVGLFDDTDDLDLSGFTAKKPTSQPQAEAVRAVSEDAQFRSREPVSPARKHDRRHRTGRNEQLNIKVTAQTLQLFYEISDTQNWVQGYTLERALAALQRELLDKAQPGE